MSLDVTILTLPFDSLNEGGSNERLRDLLLGRELARLGAFPVTHAGRPYCRPRRCPPRR